MSVDLAPLSEACERNKGPILRSPATRVAGLQPPGIGDRQRHRSARVALRDPSAAPEVAAQRPGRVPAHPAPAAAAATPRQPAGAAGARRPRSSLAGRGDRRGIHRQHPAHHGLGRRAGAVSRHRHSSRRPPSRVRGAPCACCACTDLSVTAAVIRATATSPSIAFCSIAIHSAAFGISRRSTPWLGPQGLNLQADHALPANNQLLVWHTAAARHTSCGVPAQ